MIIRESIAKTKAEFSGRNYSAPRPVRKSLLVRQLQIAFGEWFFEGS